MKNTNKNIEYVLPVGWHKRTPIAFMLVMGILSLTTVLLCSGFAEQLKLNEIFSYFAVLLFFLYGGKKPAILKPSIRTATTIIVCLFVILAVINYDAKHRQLINLCSTFGMAIFVQIFSRIKWETKNFRKLGLLWGVCSIFAGYLLMPGHIFDGWNSNSISGLYPVFVISACSFRVVENKLRWVYIGILFALFLGITSQLENRSTLIATLLLFGLMIFPVFVKNRKLFRMLYVCIILVNLLIPILNSIVANMDLFKDFIGTTSEMTASGKTGESGFNGREELWQMSMLLQGEHPLFGLCGIRLFYPHNFSMDILNNFGWIGYVIFYILLISVLEFSYREGSKYNIFLVGFMCVIFLNTFENMFTCCDYMQFFVYCLPAIALRVNRKLVVK